MRLSIITSLVYFPLAFVYKVLGNPMNNYWVNYSWFVLTVFMMLVFIDIRNNCIDDKYRLIAFIVACYWGVMAALRAYLFFDIEKHYDLIDKAGIFGFGSVFIITSFILLTFKSWYKK